MAGADRCTVLVVPTGASVQGLPEKLPVPPLENPTVPPGAALADGCPDAASMASLASRSACLLRSRGTQV